MKTRIIFLAATIITGFSFTSCENENEIPKPLIEGLELGIGNSKLAYIGADLHIEAEITAEGKIDKIHIEIHQEEGGEDEIEAEFDEFSGLKNTAFHKHVAIPGSLSAGSYHFHMTVTDLEGNSTTVEEEIQLEELADEEAPVVINLS